eukprot:gene30486-37710_t
MGSNAMSVHQVSHAEQVSGKVEWKVLLCSGGDDQSLCATVWTFEVSVDKSTSLTVTMNSLLRNLAASGSAIKGVQILSTSTSTAGSVHVASVGYDQRLSIWCVGGLDGSGDNAADALCSVVGSVNATDLTSAQANTPTVCVKISSVTGWPEERDYTTRDYQTIEREGDAALSLTWTAGEMVNVSDVCSLDVVRNELSSEGEFTCAVVGEGFQILSIAL